MNTDFTIIPPAAAIREAQDILCDLQTMKAAPRQLLHAFLALTDGASVTSCAVAELTSEDRLKWTVVAVVDGSAVVYITANGPNASEDHTGRPPEVLDLEAAVYPRTILSRVSSKAAIAPIASGQTGLRITPHYVAHFDLGDVQVDVEVDRKTGIALISLLRISGMETPITLQLPKPPVAPRRIR